MGTAKTGATLTRLGTTEPIKMFIGNMPETHIISPAVISDMADDVNMGSRMLQRASVGSSTAIMWINGKALLKIGQHTQELIQRVQEQPQMAQEKIPEGKSNHMAEAIPGAQEKIPEGKPNHMAEAIPGEERVEREARPRLRSRGGKDRRSETPPTRKQKYMEVLRDTTIKKNTVTFLEVKLQNGTPDLKTILVEPLEEPCDNGPSEVVAGIYCKKTVNKIAIINPSDESIILKRGHKIASFKEVGKPSMDEKEQIEKMTEQIGKMSITNKEAIEKTIEDLKIDENQLLAKHPEIKRKLKEIIAEYNDVFSNPNDERTIGRTSLVEFDIKLKPEAQPYASNARPLNPRMKKDLRKQLDIWEKEEIIEHAPPHTEWAAPLVPALKKDGTIRWAVDYRQLNAATVADKYPLPRIESNLEQLQGSLYYSALDAASAYMTIPVSQRSKRYLAFVTPFGLYTFARMPFGAKNSGPVYSRFVDKVISKLHSSWIVVYIDDIIVHSLTLEQHLEELARVLEAHREAGIKLRASKTHLIHDSINYLGYKVSPEGVAMIDSYVDKIMEWPVPSTRKELNTFLGFTGYYRSFIADYSMLTNEMNSAKTAEKFEWTPTMDRKFTELKKKFAEKPIRAYPDYEEKAEPFQLHVDFSCENVGAVLSQVQDGQERLIGVAGRKTTRYEKNYHSTKGELAAVLYGLRKFEHILRFKKFLLWTDNSSITWLQTAKRPRGIIYRWLSELQSFDFDIRHKPGKANVAADALSRSQHMDPPTKEEVEEEEEYIYATHEYIRRMDMPWWDIMNMDEEEEGDHEVDHILSDEDLDGIQEAQENDPILSEVRQWCETGRKPTKQELQGKPEEVKHYAQAFESLSLEQGVLYYNHTIDRVTEKPIKRLVLPEVKWMAMFKHVHEDLAGHFGERATCLKAIAKFYFPGMWVWIKTKVKQCQQCIAKKTKPNTHEVSHQPITNKGYPNETLFVDLVGPMNTTNQNNKYVLTMEDGWSRFVNAICIPNKEANTVADAIFNNHIALFGAPYQIHSDRGTEFTNKVIVELAEKWKIKKTTTPAYSPNSNLVERFHRSLNQLFRVLMEREDPEWDRYVKAAVLAHNTKVHDSTGLTPFFIHFGREAKLPVDLVIPSPNEQSTNIPDFVNSTQRNYKTVYDFVRKRQQATIRRNAKLYTNTRDKLSIGALVWYLSPVKTTEKPTKITDQWHGPFTIVEKHTEVNYVIRPVNGGRDLLVHASRLKLADPRYLVTSRQPREDEHTYGDDLGEDILPPARRSNLIVPVRVPENPAVVVDLTARQTGHEQPPPPQPPPPTPPHQITSPPGTPVQQEQPQPQEQPNPDVFVPPLSDGDDPMTRGDKRGVQPESEPETAPRRSERMRGRFEQDPNHPLAPVDRPHKTKSKTKPKRARSFAKYSDSSEDEMTEGQQKRLHQDVALQEQPSPQTSQSAPVTQQPSPQPGPSRQRVGMATRTAPYYRTRQQLPPDTLVHMEPRPSSMNSIKVQLQRGSDIPQRQTKQAAGLDVRSKKKVVLAPKSVNRIDINLKVAVPDGYFLKLESRSGLASKGIVVSGGVVDSDFRGPVEVILHNTNENPFIISAGQRIAQACLLPTYEVVWEEVDELPEPPEDHLGFGSTDPETIAQLQYDLPRL